MKRYFTSEAVTAGHPDKLCDQIADGVLDELLKQDPKSRCACEVTAWPSGVHIMGEITSSADVDYKQVARKVIQRIGYTKSEYGFCDAVDIFVSLHEQSDDIAMGVNKSLYDSFSLGSGDQGMMFGFACSETPELMPAPITYAHKLLIKASELRKTGPLNWLRPDAKSQVTVEYEDNKPVHINTVVISHQHDPDVSYDKIKESIIEEIIKPVLEPTGLIDSKTNFFVNPTGRFVVGGPFGDTGLTGRKIIVDTYGGMGRHGGGAFSGKDPSKVDRSAAYMARYIAKNIVAAGLAERCEIQLAYAIGVPFPVSIMVDTFGTGKVPEDKICKAVEKVFDCSPSGIIKTLDLKKPIYQKTASYGHFGRPEFSWEKTDKTEALKAEIK